MIDEQAGSNDRPDNMEQKFKAHCCAFKQSPLIKRFTLQIRDKTVEQAYYAYRYNQIRFYNWFLFAYHISWFIIKFSVDPQQFGETIFPVVQICLLVLQAILQVGSFRINQLLWLGGPIWFGIHCAESFIVGLTNARMFLTLIFKLQAWFIFFNTQWIIHTLLATVMLSITSGLSVSDDWQLNYTEGLFIFITVFLNYHLEQTYKDSYCEKFVSQRNHLEFKGMLNNLKDGIFIARRDQRLKVDYINRAAKILLSQNPVDLETGLLQGHSQAQQLAMQGGGGIAANQLLQNIDENEAYADKKCFVRYDQTNLAADKDQEEEILNLKDILALQQEDTATAQSFRVEVPKDTLIIPQPTTNQEQTRSLIVAIEIQNIIFQGEDSIIIYIHNISQLTENNRMKQIGKSQELLQATVSHELRTPLNCILLMCQLLQGSRLTEQGNYFARQIQVSSNLLLCFVNDLLDFNQIKNGIFNPIVQRFSFHQVLDDVLQIFIFQAKAQDTLLMFNLNLNIPTEFQGDKTRLQQVLINLIKNALKFTHGGFIKVKAEYRRKNELLQIQVCDSGKGIRDEEKVKLFTMFGKLQRTADVNQEGIGLGLTICKELCTKNGGEISVHSEGEGSGSTFSFSMKMQQIDFENEADLDSQEFKPVQESAPVQMDTQIFECEEISLSKINLDEQQAEDRNAAESMALMHPQAHTCPMLMQTSNKVNGPSQLEGNDPLKKKIGPCLMPCSARSSSRSITGSEDQQSVNNGNQQQPDGTNIVRPKRDEPAYILAVDDSTFNLEALQLILNIHFKCECDTAVSGRKALNMVEKRLKEQYKGEQPYGLVFMDYSMPNMNGLETTSRVLATYAKYGAPPPIICCLTAYTEKNFKDNALRAGMTHFVTKPADRIAIAEVLKLINIEVKNPNQNWARSKK